MAIGEAISVGVLAVVVILLLLPIGPLLLFLICRSFCAIYGVKNSLKRVVCYYIINLGKVVLKKT